MSSTRIAILADSIQQNTRIVDEYLSANGLPSPSFEPSTPPILPLPTHITQAKEAALEAMDELQALLLGPVPKLFHDLFHTPSSLTSLHAISKLKLANSFPSTSTTTVAKLAESSGLDHGDCDRLVRHAVAYRLFLEPSPGVIQHSAMSNSIAMIPLFREWIEELCENVWSSAARIVPAMEKWPGSEEPNQTAYNLAMNTDLPFFEDLATDATGAKTKRFADMIRFLDAAPGMEPSVVADNYDWGTYKSVVDVGGSHGAIAIELAKRYPEIECTVQDLPDVIAAAPKQVDRVTFQEYDFFTEQPVKNADVYLFRQIFHNYGDKYSIQILRNLIPALKKGSRVVINDHVAPDPGTLSPYKERSVRAFDLVMKECFNAKHRDINAWKQLLKAADDRFEIVGVKQPENSQMQIIDVKWDGLEHGSQTATLAYRTGSTPHSSSAQDKKE